MSPAPYQKTNAREPRRPHTKTQYRLSQPLEQLVGQVRKRLIAQDYSYGSRRNYIPCIRRFLGHLDRSGRPLTAVTPAEIERYLESLYPDPSRGQSMRSYQQSAIVYLMRMIHKAWPPKLPARTELEKFDEAQLERYEKWMLDVRGLSQSMRRHQRDELRLLQRWCRKNTVALQTITLLDVEKFIVDRSGHLKKRTMAAATSSMRSCMRYLHHVREVDAAIAPHLQGPHIYENEDLVTCPSQEQVEAAIRDSATNRTPLGLRARAILLLLTTYGFRAGEIIDLTLDDIDWKRDRITIHHRKSRRRSEFPLMPDVGEAIVNYIKHARPKCTTRNLFVRFLAPYRGLAATTVLHNDLDRVFKRAGIVRTGRRGAHSLRHFRAVSLLRNGASLKSIGDLLGHSAARSTFKYLKLATEDLRQVSLELPKELRHE